MTEGTSTEDIKREQAKVRMKRYRAAKKLSAASRQKKSTSTDETAQKSTIGIRGASLPDPALIAAITAAVTEQLKSQQRFSAEIVDAIEENPAPERKEEPEVIVPEINDEDTGVVNPGVKSYSVTLQPRHWRFAESKAYALGLRDGVTAYLEWLVRHDMQHDPVRRELAQSRTISGELLPGRNR